MSDPSQQAGENAKLPQRSEDTENPKQAGSSVVDCIPQTGDCPMRCPPTCFYNAPGFYRPKEYSKFPHPDEVGDRIVRVNSGHDSNLGGVVRLPEGHWLLPDLGVGADEPIELSRATLVEMCRYYYPRVFWNTSIPDFRFPGPVVFTCNGRGQYFRYCPPNVMAVRIRFNSWEWDSLRALAEFYDWQAVPILLTSMRYSEESSIPEAHRQDYTHKKHVLNSYWTLPAAEQFRIKDAVQGVCEHVGIVRLCGEGHSLCRDCGNCAMLFDRCVGRMQEEASK